jgi:hypothetical protein
MLLPPDWRPDGDLTERRATVLRGIIGSLLKVTHRLKRAGYLEPYEELGVAPGESNKGLAIHYRVGPKDNQKIVWVYADYSLHEQTNDDVPF